MNSRDWFSWFFIVGFLLLSAGMMIFAFLPKPYAPEIEISPALTLELAELEPSAELPEKFLAAEKAPELMKIIREYVNLDFKDNPIEGVTYARGLYFIKYGNPVAYQVISGATRIDKIIRTAKAKKM